MILDSRDVVRESALEADVCIIGAGAAGISMALELAAGPHDVVVLEGGALEYDQKSQELYDGPEEGTLIQQGSRYLASTRLRYLGGTTNHWHGWCRPLDPEDFEIRDWVENSGWPISGDDVEPFYPRACELLEISPFDYDQSTAGIYERLLAGDDHFDTNFFHMSPPTRFGQRYRPQLEAAANVRLVTDANVRSIEVEAEARHVTHLDVVRADGSPLPVRCRHYVLATGGIENARLLLNSNNVQPGGLGNDRDLVGRYFMEHPLQRVGSIVIPYRRGSVPKTYSRSFVKTRDNWVQGVIRARPAVQRRLGLLNAVMVVTPQQLSDASGLEGAIDELARDVRDLASLEPPESPDAPYLGWIFVHSEQSPNPDSRVLLADDRDRLGMRRTRLEWRLTDHEWRTLNGTSRLFLERLGTRLDARGSLLSEEDKWSYANWSNHHMGTTRMSSDVATGVVDRECRLHGVDNLFVAGSSVFTTGGCSNPTLTLVALALRLSDHLKGVLAA